MAHQGGRARPLYTPRTWEPNLDSSGNEAEVVYPEPRRSLSELGSVNLVPHVSACAFSWTVVLLIPTEKGKAGVCRHLQGLRLVLLGHLPLQDRK